MGPGGAKFECKAGTVDRKARGGTVIIEATRTSDLASEEVNTDVRQQFCVVHVRSWQRDATNSK